MNHLDNLRGAVKAPALKEFLDYIDYSAITLSVYDLAEWFSCRSEIIDNYSHDYTVDPNLLKAHKDIIDKYVLLKLAELLGIDQEYIYTKAPVVINKLTKSPTGGLKALSKFVTKNNLKKYLQ